MEQKLQTAIKTLRKSINKQQFYIQFSGTEYEVAQKPAKATEGHEACSTGQVLQDGKCGKSQQLALFSHIRQNKQSKINLSLVSQAGNL